MKIPEELRESVDDTVRRSLRHELDSRQLLLTPAASSAAAADAELRGRVLLRQAIRLCYPETAAADRHTVVEFDDVGAAGRIGRALTFGSVTANLLTPATTRQTSDPRIGLLCAIFNLGIGLVDGLCDEAPALGVPFLGLVRAQDVTAASHSRWPDGWLRSALPEVLGSDPTVAFTARVIEAFFGLLHDCYPQRGGSSLRHRVGILLEQALEAERQSVSQSAEPRDHGMLIECSRRTSTLPLLIIEQIAAGEGDLPPSTAGKLLGEVLWRIDDLVDLNQDMARGAINAVQLWAVSTSSGATTNPVAGLEQVLTSGVIPLVAARAGAELRAGLHLARGGAVASADRTLFLSFVQRYAGLEPGRDGAVEW